VMRVYCVMRVLCDACVTACVLCDACTV